MPTDLDICRSASILIEHHGKDATLEAARRADAMLVNGDVEGNSVWPRLGRAIEVLQAKRSSGERSN